MISCLINYYLYHSSFRPRKEKKYVVLKRISRLSPTEAPSLISPFTHLTHHVKA